MQFDLKFSAAFWIPLVFAILAFLLTWYVYRRTTPASSRLLRRTLAAIRYLSLATVLLLLFEPVLNLRWLSMREPTIAVVVDESASMALIDSTTRRSDRLKEIVQMPWLEKLQRSTNLQIMAFADSLRPIAEDSLAHLRFAGDGTDIAAALTSARKRFAADNFAAVVLLSDGNSNLGENPVRVAQNYAVPIFTLGIGSPKQSKDVVLTQIVTNEIAYAETQVPVEITLSAQGYAGRSARLRLDDAAGLLAEQQVILPADHMQTTVRLNVTPRQLGMNKFTASIEVQPGETSDVNNRRSAFVRVLQSKMRIWIISGSPSADYQFAKRTLENDRNFSVTGFVQEPGGAFYGGKQPSTQAAAWKDVDCLIFIDFPRRDSNAQFLAALVETLHTTQKPAFWMAGPGVDPARWWMFQRNLPLASQPVRGQEKIVAMIPDPVGMSHPLGRFAESPDDNRELWESLPPIFSSFTGVRAVAGAQIIAVSDQAGGRTPLPLLIAQKSASTKTAVLLAHGLWRWNLKLVGIGREPIAYQHLIIQGVRWLATNEDMKLVRFTTNKLIYRGGEAVEMSAQVYYEDYRPRPGVKVTARLTGGGIDREILFDEVGDGLYRASTSGLPGGDYELRGYAGFNEQRIGEDAAKFSVEPFSVEYLTTSMNEMLLRRISEASGGRYLTADGLDLLAEMKFPEEKVEQSRELAAWGRPGILIFVIILLGAEWFLRKRNGML